MGIKQSISKSEEIILEILEKENPLTMQQIMQAARERTDWADSTIKTFVRRLVKKGAVKETQCEVQYFEPVFSRKARSQMALKNVVDEFFAGSYRNAILNFVENDCVSKEEMADILAMLEEEEK